jgi:hypothetical protein
MRRVIESTLVSIDGVIGDPAVWAGEYFDKQAESAAFTATASGSSSAAAVLNPVDPSIATTSTPSLQDSGLNRPGSDGGSGVSRVLRGRDFWILVPDTWRSEWEDGDTRQSFAVRSST